MFESISWREWKGRQWIEQAGLCHWCKRRMEKHNRKSKLFATIEHLTPLAQGGADHPSNCVLACFTCNNQRGDESWKNSHWYRRAEAENRVRGKLGFDPLPVAELMADASKAAK